MTEGIVKPIQIGTRGDGAGVKIAGDAQSWRESAKTPDGIVIGVGNLEDIKKMQSPLPPVRETSIQAAQETSTSETEKMSLDVFRQYSTTIMRSLFQDPDLAAELNGLGIKVTESSIDSMSRIAKTFFDTYSYSEIFVEYYFQPIEEGQLQPKQIHRGIFQVMDILFDEGYRHHLVVQKEPPNHKDLMPKANYAHIKEQVLYDEARNRYIADREAWEEARKYAQVQKLRPMLRQEVDLRAVVTNFAKMAIDSYTDPSSWTDNQEQQATAIITAAYDRLAGRVRDRGGWERSFTEAKNTEDKLQKIQEFRTSRLQSRSIPPPENTPDNPRKSTVEVEALLAKEGMKVENIPGIAHGTRGSVYEVEDPAHPDLKIMKVFLQPEEAEIEATNMKTVNDAAPGTTASFRLVPLSDGTGAIQMESFPPKQGLDYFLSKFGKDPTPEQVNQFVGYCSRLLVKYRQLSRQGINVMVDRKLDDYWFRAEEDELIPVIGDHGLLETYQTSDWEHILTLFQFGKSLRQMTELLYGSERAKIRQIHGVLGMLLQEANDKLHDDHDWFLVTALMDSDQIQIEELNRRCGEKIRMLEEAFGVKNE